MARMKPMVNIAGEVFLVGIIYHHLLGALVFFGQQLMEEKQKWVTLTFSLAKENLMIWVKDWLGIGYSPLAAEAGAKWSSQYYWKLPDWTTPQWGIRRLLSIERVDPE